MAKYVNGEPLIGIYRIYHQGNGKEYIGQSHDIQRRWRQHTQALNNGTHGTPKLQRAWATEGADQFIFEVLELCSLDQLTNREQWYFDTRIPWYNSSLVAGATMRGYHHSDVTREKWRKAHKGKTLSPAHIASLSAVRKGINKPKSVAAMVAATTNKPKTAEHKAKLREASTTFRLRNPERHAEMVKKRTESLRRNTLKPGYRQARSEALKKGWITRRAKMASQQEFVQDCMF